MTGAWFRQKKTAILLVAGVALAACGRPDSDRRPVRAALAEARRAEWQASVGRGDWDAALRSMQAAYDAGLTRHDLGVLARDAYGLAEWCRDARDYDAARRAVAMSRRAAITSVDGPMLRYAELGESELARLSGDFATAEGQLRRLLAVAAPPEQRWLQLKLGILHLHDLQFARARIALEKALDLLAGGRDAESRALVAAVHLNLAVVEYLAGRHVEALGHYAIALVLGEGAVPGYELRFMRARIEAARGHHAEAAVILREILTATLDGRWAWSVPSALRAVVTTELDGEWTWSVPLQLGRSEEQLGNLAAAEAAYARAIAAVQQVRAGSGAYEPIVIASHRQPYEALLGILARTGRWSDALAQLADLDARHMISAMARPTALLPDAPLGTPAAPVVPLEDVAAAAPVEVVVNAWRGRRLVAVFPAGKELCRIEVMDGAVTGACVGDLAALERDAEALDLDPTDAGAAARLGAALVPPGPDGERLDLLIVGAVGRAPLAALRDGRGMIVGRRPLARVLGLLGGARGPWTGGAVVLGAPTGGLPAALDEARAVAALLRTDALRVGPAGDQAALREARGGRALHIAAHAVVTRTGPVLQLADGPLALSQIAQSGPAPRVVVVATCNSATALDEGGWGSLASAFVLAGAESVVATLRSVPDAEVRPLIERFYREGGDVDPARALGAVQAAVGGDPQTRTHTWAAFTVIAAPPAPR